MSSFGLRRFPVKRVMLKCLFLSFDGAKVRRFFGLRKRLRKIVCDNSPFVDACQIMGQIWKISYFCRKPTRISGKMRNFAAHYINKV